MAMPRPSGKARKIAEATIPGLNRNQQKKSSYGRKPSKKKVELTIIDINENRGKG